MHISDEILLVRGKTSHLLLSLICLILLLMPLVGSTFPLPHKSLLN